MMDRCSSRREVMVSPMSLPSELQWLDGVAVSVVACDTAGVCTYMNERACSCLPRTAAAPCWVAAWSIVTRSRRAHACSTCCARRTRTATTVEKAGKKLIHQAPFLRDGVFAGVVEIASTCPTRCRTSCADLTCAGWPSPGTTPPAGSRWRAEFRRAGACARSIPRLVLRLRGHHVPRSRPSRTRRCPRVGEPSQPRMGILSSGKSVERRRRARPGATQRHLVILRDEDTGHLRVLGHAIQPTLERQTRALAVQSALNVTSR